MSAQYTLVEPQLGAPCGGDAAAAAQALELQLECRCANTPNCAGAAVCREALGGGAE